MTKTLTLKTKKRVIVTPKLQAAKAAKAAKDEPTTTPGEPEPAKKVKATKAAKGAPTSAPVEPEPAKGREGQAEPEPAKLVPIEAPDYGDERNLKQLAFKQQVWLFDYLNKHSVIQDKKPLMLGAYKEIQKAVGEYASGKVIRHVLGILCGRVGYVEKLVEGGARFNPITGEITGEITSDEQAKARLKLDWLNAKVAAAKAERFAENMQRRAENAAKYAAELRAKEREIKAYYYENTTTDP